jgi:hypothetical protein
MPLFTSLLVALFTLATLTSPLLAEAGNRSAIQRLKLQRASTQQSQIYVPRGFLRNKDNTVTVRGTGQDEQVAILYRYLPLKEGDTQAPEKIMLDLGTDARVKQVSIPLPTSEQFQEEDKKPRLKQVDTPEASEPITPEGYQYNSIQLQAVVIDAEGKIVKKLPMIGANGQPTPHDVLPLIEPHDPNQAVVLPALPGVDPNALRGIQTMAELAGNEDKRKRLQDDGAINRGRAIDKNSLINGAGGGLTGPNGR